MAFLKGCIQGCFDGFGTYPPAPFLQGKGSKVSLMAYINGYSDSVVREYLSPGPVIRFAHCRLRLCLRGKGSKAPLMASFVRGPIPRPLSYEERGVKCL